MEAEYFRRLGYIDIHNLAHRVQAQVLWAVGLMDVSCPPSSQFAAYNRLTCKKEMRIFPDFGHEYLPRFGDEVMQFLIEMGDDQVK